MKRSVYLKSFILMILFLISFVAGSFIASAAEVVTEYNGSKYKVISVNEENELYFGLKHTEYTAESSYINETYGTDVGRTLPNKFYSQNVNVLEVPNKEGVQVVHWSYLPSSSSKGWMTTTLTTMISNYETHNPGYKVLAAINGDFYDINATGTYGPLLKTIQGVCVSNGEVLKPIDSSGRVDSPLPMGFKNSGDSSNYLQGAKVEFTPNHILALYDENDNIVEEIEIKHINEVPTFGEVAVYFSYPTGRVNNVQGYQLVDIPGENAYICNTPIRLVPSTSTDLYAKGALTEITEAQTIQWGSFGIVTESASIREKINNAAYVRVQKTVVGAYAGYSNIGCANFPLFNNGAMFHSWDTNREPRTVIGAKADGSVVMVTVDGRKKDLGYWGMTCDETAALMKHHGCVSAVNLDGGGSTAIVVRDKTGKLVVLNTPSDGALRSISDCYLVVVKEDNFKVESKTVKNNEITLNLDTTAVDFNEVTSIKCTLNGITKEVVDNKVTFDGLDSNKEYEYKFTYDTKTANDIETMVVGSVFTSKQVPTFGELIAEVGSNKIIFTPTINDPDATLKYYRLFINDNREAYLEEPIEVKIDLTGLEKVEFDVLIAYDLNDGLGAIEITEKYVCILETGKVYLFGEEPDDPVDNPTDNPVDDPTDDPTDDPVDDPTDKPENPSDDKDSGCKKDVSMVIISLISLSSLLALIRKRK